MQTLQILKISPGTKIKSEKESGTLFPIMCITISFIAVFLYYFILN